MNYFIIPSALIIALLLTFIFSALSGQGPWRALYLFFFIIFLVSWAEQLWVTPFGPVIWGISLLPLIFVAVIFSFLIIALSPPPNPPTTPADNKTVSEPEPEDESVFAMGMFFWLLIVTLITSIAIGYYKTASIANGLK